MSCHDARDTVARQPEGRSSRPAARPASPWTAALGRDAREFAQTAEYEFRKLVGASRSTIQQQPRPEAAIPDRSERKPLGRRKPPAEAAAEGREGRAAKPGAPNRADKE